MPIEDIQVDSSLFQGVWNEFFHMPLSTSKMHSSRILLILLVFNGHLVSGQGDSHVIRQLREKSSDITLVCAHRSYHKNAPENSIASIKEAIRLQIDMLELDVRTTQDDSLVLMHDTTIDRTTNGSGEISKMTYSQLAHVRLLHMGKLTDQRIPLLSDILTLERAQEVFFNLDLKDVDLDRLLQILRRHGVADKVISFIEKPEEVLKMKALDSTYAILPLVSSSIDIAHFDTLLHSPLIHLTKESATIENSNLIKSNEQLSFVNALGAVDRDLSEGRFEELEKLLSLKPTIIQTDHPMLLMEYLQGRGTSNANSRKHE